MIRRRTFEIVLDVSWNTNEFTILRLLKCCDDISDIKAVMVMMIEMKKKKKNSENNKQSRTAFSNKQTFIKYLL